jgi:sterol desaturase/sphingolipid hydroxylase (fatty acid hydroxylase superfamily)
MVRDVRARRQRTVPNKRVLNLLYVPMCLCIRWARVFAINVYQLLVVMVGMYTWEHWFVGRSLFQLRNYVGPEVGGVLAYIISTHVFYWWHLVRHECYWLWCTFHSLHHSPSRLEAITSFYKDPKEILIDSIMLTALMYSILGLTSESSVWMNGCAALAEEIYHANINTPRWMGYFVQRPESHLVHHMRNRRAHCFNYSDLPVWDMLGGTWRNPETFDGPVGYEPEQEAQVLDMLLARDVLLPKETYPRNTHRKRYSWSTLASLMLLCVGFLHSVAHVFYFPHAKGVAFATVASPLPLVFSVYNGVETFSTTFHITAYECVHQYQPWSTFGHSLSTEHELISTDVTPRHYAQLHVPYNLRNAYGALFSHGPFFNDTRMIRLRDTALRYAFCDPTSSLLRAFDMHTPSRVAVTITSNALPTRNRQWHLHTSCSVA